MEVESRIMPKKCVICLGHKPLFSLFITKPSRYRCATTRWPSCTAAAPECEATNQSPKQLYTRKPRRRNGAIAASMHFVNTLGAREAEWECVELVRNSSERKPQIF